MTKSQLRKIYFEKQKTLSDAERHEKSLRIADRFFDIFDLKAIHCLHIFLAIERNREIETAFILERLQKNFLNLTIVVSRIDFQTMTLEHLHLKDSAELVENKWHIPEPTNGEIVEIERIDAVLVPLLCFDKTGFRVGYGKGFYDKFLSECRKDCLKIGLSYFAPVKKISDAQEFDVKLDFCITPGKIVNCKS